MCFRRSLRDFRPATYFSSLSAAGSSIKTEKSSSTASLIASSMFRWMFPKRHWLTPQLLDWWSAILRSKSGRSLPIFQSW